MAKEIFTEETIVPESTISDKIAVDAITITCAQREPIAVQFTQFAYPTVNGVMKPENKKYIGTMRVELATPESLMEQVEITSPLDQSKKTLAVAEIAEFITQYWVNKYEASLVPTPPTE